MLPIGGSRGGLGGTCPPLDYLKYNFVFELFFCWCTCLAKLAYRMMNIAGDERTCGKYLSCASESGRFLEMRYEKFLLLPPPPPLNRDAFRRSGKMSATTPPPTESGRLLEIKENFCYYPPPLPTESGRIPEIRENVCYYPPPTESGRLLEIKENFCYYPPPPLNRDGFWRSRKISDTTPPPSQLLCPS